MATPDPTSPTARNQADAEAAVWLARCDAGLTAPEQAQFERWLAADPRHSESWRDLESAWVAFDRLRGSEAADAMVHKLYGHKRRWRWKVRIGTAAVTIAAAAATWILLLNRPAFSPSAGAAATANLVVFRPKRRVLPDQSIVELNQGAEIEIHYQPDRRDILLIRGEAHFAVAKNPARPFVVTAGNVQVRAVGTEFAVKLGQENTDLLVTEGKVSVNRTTGSPTPQDVNESGLHAPSPIMVPAGGLLVVPISDAKVSRTPLKVETLPAAEIEQRLEWRQPRVELSGTPLAEAISVFNREAHVHLSIEDPALAKLRMSGVFRADNVEGFVRLLQSSYGVKVEHRGSEMILHLAQ